MIGRARYRFEDEQFRMGQRIRDAALDGITSTLNHGKRHLVAVIIIGGVYTVAVPAVWFLSFPVADWFMQHLPGFRQ